jgi:hypothetical protein
MKIRLKEWKDDKKEYNKITLVFKKVGKDQATIEIESSASDIKGIFEAIATCTEGQKTDLELYMNGGMGTVREQVYVIKFNYDDLDSYKLS